MKKNCLTCRYEPEWEKWYPYERGECKFPFPKCECAAIVIGKGFVYRTKHGKGYALTIANKKFVCGEWAVKEEK